MHDERNSESVAAKARTNVERQSDRELRVTRVFNAPARIVFEAWSRPELFTQWWVPTSTGMTLLSCDMDIRVGGTYRLVFQHPAFPEPMAFHGKYLEVVPPSRLVWTNEESGGPGPVTTVTFEEKNGQTHVVVVDLYPSKESLDEAAASGATSGWPEQFSQLDEMLETMSA